MCLNGFLNYCMFTHTQQWYAAGDCNLQQCAHTSTGNEIVKDLLIYSNLKFNFQ